MPNAFGWEWVKRDLAKHKRHTGKVTSATLVTRQTSPTTVAYANAYVWPQDETTGIGADGTPYTQGTVTLWRVGETTAPRVDDELTVGGTVHQILRINTRLNADESRHYAVYDLTVVT